MNKETWIQIKKEYEEGICKHVGFFYFLCNSSITFETLWLTDADTIKTNAFDFLMISETSFVVGEASLFVSWNDYVSTDEKIKIRLQFLDYMINKTE